jgi:cleavage stimulation factor subunit 3
MAEEDAEIALLHQMQAGQESMAWGDGADGHEGGVLPSNTENSDQQVKEENFSDDQVLRALSPSISGVTPDEDTYVPLSPPPLLAAGLTPGRLESRSSSRASARKPKTIGGFLADDSDEEDLLPTMNASQGISSTSKVLLQPPADNYTRSVSRSPLHISSTSAEQHSADVQNVSPKAATNTNNSLSVDRGEHSSAPSISTQKAVPISSEISSSGPNIPKARLPHDRVGILEDRIKEDPRGDLDAWLSLISEHRKRNKIADARAVYERFFKVFPSAVRWFFPLPYFHQDACTP